MADRDDKLPGNRAGTYYVDSQCIDCDLCRQSAPHNFQRNDVEGFSYVFKQPKTETEMRECEEALDECPVEALEMASRLMESTYGTVEVRPIWEFDEE